MTGDAPRPAPCPRHQPHRTLAAALLSVLGLVACTATPGERFHRAARDQGLEAMSLTGAGHDIRAYFAPAATPNDATPLHIYLTGDGSPWVLGRYPATDPTPRDPLALRLMARDPAPRLLIHRPCYGHREPPAGCDGRLWTRARYGDEVLAALDQALDQALERLGPRPVVLIGYSGGGTIAWLLARRRDDVRALITVAANLDTRRWTRVRGFLPLTGSLNPAELGPLPDTMLQWHLVGGLDQVVPDHVTETGLGGAPAARVLRYPDFDHDCCWERVWPDILRELASVLADGRPAR